MINIAFIRVLLIEDDAGDAQLTKIALRQAKDVTFDITWVESIQQAKEALKNATFHIVLLDLSLPDSNGLETIHQAKKLALHLPIIVLSGHGDTNLALEALKIGATDYVVKGSDANDLTRMIRYGLLRGELEDSKRKLAEAHLDLDLLHTLDSATIIAETDLHGRISFVNQQFCEISGYREAELLGQTHKIMSSGVHSKEFYLHLWARIKSGRAWSGEICNRRKTGEPYWLQAIILPIYRKNSEDTYFYKYAIVGLDVTEKKQREVAMQNRAALYEAAIETTDGFCRISSGGKILEVSDGYCQLSGYSRDELLELNILQMNESFALSLQQFSHLIQDNGKTFEVEQHRKDGSLWLAEITAAYSTLPDRSLFLFLHDVTVQREMQKRDKIQREQLAHMQKIDSIGRLTAGIGHDFNNILTSILGYNELCKIIAEDVTDNAIKEDLDKSLQQVEIAGRRAVELIAKMMNYCRQSTSASSDIDKLQLTKPTREVIKEVVEMVRSGLPRKIQIELDLHETANITIAPIDLHQIMTNLLVNARDAMKEKGGTITVKLHIANLLTYQCAACLMPVEGEFIELSISDTGTGIDEKVIDEIFDPFFTTKKEGEGTGLGLSTVSGIVHHARGHILIDSQLGVGTTFKLLFKKL